MFGWSILLLKVYLVSNITHYEHIPILPLSVIFNLLSCGDASSKYKKILQFKVPFWWWQPKCSVFFFRSDSIVLCMTFHTWANGFFRHFPCYKDRKIFLPYQICNITRSCRGFLLNRNVNQKNVKHTLKNMSTLLLFLCQNIIGRYGESFCFCMYKKSHKMPPNFLA